jgi:hypothetical protein
LPFNNEAVAIVVAVILLFPGGRSCEARETILELGAGFLSGEYSQGQAIILAQRFDKSKYAVGLGVVGDQVCQCVEGEVILDTNAFFFASRQVHWKRLEVGIGAAYWQNTNRVLGRHLTYQLVFAVNLWKELDLRLRHYSNAGSGGQNLGQDMIGLSWRFQ